MDFTQPAQTCQLGDVGVALVVQVVDPAGAVIDVSAATGMKIKLKMPDGTTKDFTAVLYTNGTDGKIVYYTRPGDINQTGEYGIQGKLTIAGGPKSSFIGGFQVFPNVDDN